MEFKFRIDDGRWLDPPAAASNTRSGNLVFAPEASTARLRAELAGPRDVRVRMGGGVVPLSLDPSAYRLTNARGEALAVASVFWTGHDEVQLCPTPALDVSRHGMFVGCDADTYPIANGYLHGQHYAVGDQNTDDIADRHRNRVTKCDTDARASPDRNQRAH